MRLSAPALLIDINGIGGLDGIAHKAGTIEIGALTRHAAAERSETIARHAPLIARALPHIGHVAIRNRGTLGGSIAFADPAAELPACLLALDGEVDATGPKGKRTIKARRFLQGPVRDRARTAGRAHRHSRSRREQGHARRLCRIGPPARRLRHGRAWPPARAPTARALADVRLAFFGVGATALRAQQGGSRAGRRQCRCRGRRARSRSARRLAGQRRGQEASRRRAAAPRGEAADGGAVMSDHALDISLTVNGERVSERVEARKTLVDFLREDLSLTGSHVGCEHGVCGACTVRVNGEIVRGCLMLAVQCDGATVETIEGLSDSGEIADLQAAFEQRNALQCGYCTPGMLAAAQDLLQTRRRAEPRGHPRASLRQLLPLHRLPRHRRCGGSGGAGSAREANEMKITDELPARRSSRARPAEFLHRPLGAAAELATAHAGARAICQRRHAAAHGACRLRALAARACAHQVDRRRRREESARRDRRGHRRRARQGDDALGRRAHASEGPEIGAAIRRSRSIVACWQGEAVVRRGRAHARQAEDACELVEVDLRGIAGGHRSGNRARCQDAGDPCRARRQSLLRAQARGRRGRQGLRRIRRGGGDHLHVRPPHRRHHRAARRRRRLESEASSA